MCQLLGLVSSRMLLPKVAVIRGYHNQGYLRSVVKYGGYLDTAEIIE